MPRRRRDPCIRGRVRLWGRTRTRWKLIVRLGPVRVRQFLTPPTHLWSPKQSLLISRHLFSQTSSAILRDVGYCVHRPPSRPTRTTHKNTTDRSRGSDSATARMVCVLIACDFVGHFSACLRETFRMFPKDARIGGSISTNRGFSVTSLSPIRVTLINGEIYRRSWLHGTIVIHRTNGC